MPVFGLKAKQCTHVPGASAEPRAASCEGCGSRFNLRSCAECGYVGCCESQLGHDREHALSSGHPVIVSMPVSRGSFTWCYECRRYV
jgi:CPA1 family monovalent cation:H+ antiporter